MLVNFHDAFYFCHFGVNSEYIFAPGDLSSARGDPGEDEPLVFHLQVVV